MSNLSFDRPTAHAVGAAAPTSRWGVARRFAVAGLILIGLVLVGSSMWLWTLTAGAPIGWRLRTLLPNAFLGVPCALGCAVAAFSPVPWRRRAGWGLVVVTLLAQCVLTAYWLASHG
ncbi:MAG TPA: hypothetical protein VNU46_05335 [Gemmatimonadaceae bacterium]|jgi:hypothetical protein|nr:hypothetical protein [Gemmatimonadaceae bacterium]